ncbi:hypothetical protein Tco_0447936 [Tanacetum coccineum]
MAEIGCNWARIGPSKSSQSLSIAHKWAVVGILAFSSPIRRSMGAKQGAGWFWYWREEVYTSWAVTEGVIPKTTNLPPIPKVVTETPVTTSDPRPYVTPIILTVKQTTTPILTPTITIDAPTITTAIPKSNALSASYVLKVVDSYLDTKVGDVYQKELQKHTADLIHKYSLQHLPELTKKPTPTTKQESEKIPSKILKIKKEQKYANQSLHAKTSFNKNPANNQLYHALMKALIKDENAIDKGVADIVKDHKRKHDDDENDDDEDPPAGSKQGTTLAKEPVEEPINWRPPTHVPEWNKRQVVLDQPAQPWFNQMVSASKDPLTFNDLMATPIDFSKYVLNGLKIKNLTQDFLLGLAFNLLKGTCSSSIELEYNFQECFNALTDNLDWNNPEGDRYPFDLSKPLHLQGPLGHRTVVADYFFNNDLEYLKTSDPEVTYTTSTTKTKDARYEIKGIKDMVPTLWSTIKHAYDKDALMGIKHWGERRKSCEDMLLLAVQHKVFHLDENIIVDFIMALQYHFRLDYNIEMPKRKWMAVDRKRSGLMIELIDKQLRQREIIRNLERLVGARELEMDYTH